MTLQSMTGFARADGSVGAFRWAWEARSVNGRSFDLRLRLPPGFERLDPTIRKSVSSAVQRGNLQLTLTVSRDETPLQPVVNEAALDAIVELVERLADRVDAAPPTLDGLLNLRGVLEVREPDIDPEDALLEEEAIIEGLQSAIDGLVEMREAEGEKIGSFLLSQVDGVAALVQRIDADPSRQPDAIVERLAAQVKLLRQADGGLDENRLHMEAAILAAKADLREEIDRLAAHVEACRELLGDGGAIGRKLDFIAQEFNRETNTICSKSNAASVTALGLELKVLIDQFREQVQNLE